MIYSNVQYILLRWDLHNDHLHHQLHRLHSPPSYKGKAREVSTTQINNPKQALVGQNPQHPSTPNIWGSCARQKPTKIHSKTGSLTSRCADIWGELTPEVHSQTER